VAFGVAAVRVRWVRWCAMQDAVTLSHAASPADPLQRALRRATWRLIPFMFLLYLVALPRPGERGIRAAADETGARFSDAVYGFRRGAVLHRLLSVRAAEQPAARARRAAPLDGADHDQLGAALVVDDAGQRGAQLLRAPVPAGAGRGGFLPGDDPLPDLLVSCPRAGGPPWRAS